MLPKRLYVEIAQRMQAVINCAQSGNEEWFAKHNHVLDLMERNLLPSGSGIDSGTKINRSKSHQHKVVLTSSYHCMDEAGFYDGWLDFTVTVTPSLVNRFDLTISGRFSDRNYKYEHVKEYLEQLYDECLSQMVVVESIDGEIVVNSVS